MSTTVTATWTGGSPTGRLLHVFVLTGATESGGAAAKNVSGFNGNLAFTPNDTNSWLVWSLYDLDGGTAFSSLTNNTLQDNFSTTHGERLGDGYFTGTVTGGVGVTVGATSGDGSTSCVGCAYEIPATGGSTPAIDASTPVTVSATSSGTTLTTAGFTPPSGAVLVAVIEGNNTSTNCSIGDNTGGALTWTRRDTSASGVIGVWTATVASGTSVSGVVATAALAAPAGSVTAGATVSGVVATAALAAPAGSVSAGATVAGAVAGLALAAPAGTAAVAVPGPAPGLALAAPAGSVGAGASVSGAVAALALAAPAGVPGFNEAVSGAVAGLTFAAPAGAPVVAAVFPQAPLDAMTELDLAGTWTSITSYVYQRADTTITRGRQDESTQTQPSTLTQTWNNRDGRFSAKNPLGAYYGSFGRNTPIRVSVPDQGAYLRLEDDATSYISCPASAGIEIAGDFDVRLDMKLTSWHKCTLAARYDGGTAAWWWGLNDDATLGFWWYDSGGTARQVTSTVPVPYYGRFALRVTVAASSGTATFYTAPTISGSWTQLGQPVDTAGTSVRGGTSPIHVGYSADFASTGFGFGGLQGRVYAFQLLNGIGGTVEAGPDFTTATAGASTFTDAQSNTWTLQGTAEFSGRLYRGHFELAATPQAWDPTGSDIYCQIQGGGLLRRLQQNTQTLGSVFYRAFTQTDAPDDLVAYWSCEDGNALASGAVPANPTQWASAVPGVAAGTFTGTPGFASDESFLCSQALPTVSGSRWHFRLPSRATADSANVFRFLLHMPSASDTNNAVIARMYTTGTIGRFDLVYTTGGNLTVVGYDQTGSQLFSNGPATFGTSGTDGTPVWCSLELQTSGGDVQYSVVELEPGASTGFDTTGTVAGSVGNATELVINGDLTHSLQSTAAGQVTYQATWESMFDFYQQLDAYQGESAGNRFYRLCGEQGVPCRLIGPADDSVVMGAQTTLAFADLLQEVADADAGMIYEPREALALGYRSRASLQNQAAAVTLDYSQAELADPVGETEDDQYTMNDVTVTRAYASTGGGTGSSAEVAIQSGPLSVQAPPNGVGEYPNAATQNLFADSQCYDAAGWLAWTGTVNDPRYPQIQVNLARQETLASSTLGYEVQYTDIGDRFTVGNTPAWLPPDGITQLVNGETETLNAFVYDIAWCGIPELPYETGTLGNLVFGVDTDGSTLHASATSTATSITVDTTAASPTYLWTTNSGDWPFDIEVGGERMTVTAISGSSSPQTFTVTRSVNGVVKAQAAGTAVSLFSPAIESL